MQTLFGKMPIEKLNNTTSSKNNSSTILFLGGLTICLAIVAYKLYQNNLELKQKIYQDK